jgi:preprotein translocase subunit YajC
MILLQASLGEGSQSLIMFGLIFAVMYFFMIRPQIKKQKKENQFRTSLKKNDKVITIGGINGKIIELGNTSVVIEVHGGSKLKVQRTAISMNSGGELADKK